MPVRKDARGRWHIEICYRRTRVHRVLHENATKAQAQALEASIRNDLFLARAGASDRTIADALAVFVRDHLKHQRSYEASKGHVTRLADWVGNKRLSDAPQVAETFKAEARTFYKPATINRSLAALRRACHLAFLAKWTTQPVHLQIKSLPERNQRHVYLDRPQIAKLLGCCDDPQTKDAIIIAVYTGMRLGEIMRLTPEHVRKGAIWLAADTKTDRARSIPILPVIRPALKRLPIKHYKRKVQWEFNRARAKAGLAHVHFHDLRHTTASLLAQAGVSLYTVGEILGHSSPQTTKRYAHLDEKTKRAAMRKLA